MGKQSARMYFRGNEHSDVYFKNEGEGTTYNHYKIYRGNQLLWERSRPKFIFTNSNGYIHTSEKIQFLSSFIKFNKSAGECAYGFETYFIKAYDDENYYIYYSQNGYEWKELIKFDNEICRTLKKDKKGILVLTDKRLLRITQNENCFSAETIFYHDEVLENNKTCIGAASQILVGDEFTIIAIHTDKIVRIINTVQLLRGYRDCLIMLDNQTNEIRTLNTALNFIPSFQGGCYHAGYFYCVFWNGKEDFYGENPIVTLERTKDGYSWETYISSDILSKFDGYSMQLFFAKNNLFIAPRNGMIIKTNDGKNLTETRIPVSGTLFYIKDALIFSNDAGDVYKSTDLLESYEKVKITEAGSAHFISMACADESIEVIF